MIFCVRFVELLSYWNKPTCRCCQLILKCNLCSLVMLNGVLRYNSQANLHWPTIHTSKKNQRFISFYFWRNFCSPDWNWYISLLDKFLLWVNQDFFYIYVGLSFEMHTLYNFFCKVKIFFVKMLFYILVNISFVL